MHGNGPWVDVHVVVCPEHVTETGQVVIVMILVVVMVELPYRVVEDSMVEVSVVEVSGGGVVVLLSVVVVIVSVGYDEEEDESGGGVGQAGAATVMYEVPAQLLVHGLRHSNAV